MQKAVMVNLFYASILLGATTEITTVDTSGKSVPHVLVIVKSLESGEEVARHLTDDHGLMQQVSLGEGLYRIIGTCPYGPCETAVQEVFGSEVKPHFSFLVRGPESTRHTIIQTFDASGAPFPDVLIIVKARRDNVEVGRYLTDKDGKTPQFINSGGLTAIATCPYGICETITRDLTEASFIAITVPIRPTDARGERIGDPRIQLTVQTPSKGPIEIRMIIRDPAANWEELRRVRGSAIVELSLLSDHLDIVFITGKCIFKRFASRNCRQQASESTPAGYCIPLKARDGDPAVPEILIGSVKLPPCAP